MKLVHFAFVAGIALSAPAISYAQVAGSTLAAKGVVFEVDVRTSKEKW